MYTLITESLQIKGNNDIDLNLTRFGDCCVMAKRWEIEDERKVFEDHVDYVYEKCLEVNNNGGCINIYKNVKVPNGKLERIDMNTLSKKDEVENFIKAFKEIQNIL